MKKFFILSSNFSVYSFLTGNRLAVHYNLTFQLNVYVDSLSKLCVFNETHSRYLMQCLTHGRHSSNDNDYKESPDNIRHSVSDHKNGQIIIKTETSTLKSAISYHSILWNNCDCNMIGGKKKRKSRVCLQYASIYSIPKYLWGNCKRSTNTKISEQEEASL